MPIKENITSPDQLLEAVYADLGFNQGALVAPSSDPFDQNENYWIEKGDWLSLAKHVKADKLFFVDQQPVIVFAKSESNDVEALRDLYNSIWSMARPRLLFLATPGNLSVYDLGKPPVKENEELKNSKRFLDEANTIVEVQSKLKNYHREQIESGALFAEQRFGEGLKKADRSLIRDLKIVLQELKSIRGTTKPRLEHLHALIGRAIFVRYLEDRKIIKDDYFKAVAEKNKSWIKILEEPIEKPVLNTTTEPKLFYQVLKDKNFTFAFFDQLALDFNGDMFPVDDAERESIQETHLERLRYFLLGEPSSAQPKLFFYAYKFDIIPIELISSIYEEFYNEREGKEKNQGSHYTPSSLVEFVLSKTLTPQILDTKPRILDPACGSGIFLVESYRRVIRHLWIEQNRRPDRTQLLKILRGQIAGIDINSEAVRIAAFSLYLAFLHYQEPREINNERQLPYLKWVTKEEQEKRKKTKPEAKFLDVLFAGNSFDLVSVDVNPELSDRFATKFDVVVGNPPWGYPKDVKGRKTLESVIKWCNPKDGRPIGDKELSQAFIHFSLAVLNDGGRVGMLVSSGVFFKHKEPSKAFRRAWLNSAQLLHVVNFSHVRNIFFSGPDRESKAIAPFVSIVYEKIGRQENNDSKFEYWSAKRTATVENLQSVILTKADMHWLSQLDCLSNENLWKIYWWGGYNDEKLILKIKFNPSLKSYGLNYESGGGYIKGKQEAFPSDWLKKYKSLDLNSFFKYGQLPKDGFTKVPSKVKYRGKQDVYFGPRLLIGEGIKSGGLIYSRLEEKSFCFTDSIVGFRLDDIRPSQRKIVQGIFWSSLAKYYFFLTASSWGTWNFKVLEEEMGAFPVHLNPSTKLKNRIVQLVEKLQNCNITPNEYKHITNETLLQSHFQFEPQAEIADVKVIEKELDEAIFDLYDLSVSERELVHDLCTNGLDLFYNHSKSKAIKEMELPFKNWGKYSDVAKQQDGLSAYIDTFLSVWNKEIASDGEFVWQIITPPSKAPLLAVRFETRYKNNLDVSPDYTDQSGWGKLLARLSKDSLVQQGSSNIFIDTFFRMANEKEIIFIKRNERRFWTKASAREDAESVFVHLSNSQTLQGGR